MFKMSPTWNSARTDTSEHGLLHIFKGPGEIVNGLTDVKMHRWSALHFQLQLKKIGFLNVPIDKNLKGLVPWKLSAADTY